MTDNSLYQHHAVPDDEAEIVLDPTRSGEPVDERLFGKFCEHLGRNIANGMHAQVLINPTFGPWEFADGAVHPDGGVWPESNEDLVRVAIEEYCAEWELPNPEALFQAFQAGTAFGWVPTGDRVRTPPETSPEGNRAQRISPRDNRGGMLQKTYFPLHRTASYELTTRVRATEETEVTIGVYEPGATPLETEPLDSVRLDIDRAWKTFDRELDLSAAVQEGEPYVVGITTGDTADVVVDLVTIYPDDHINKADPEVVSYLRDVDLPLLRWPGGNFVSGYHWEDGVGPIEERRSRINPAWGHGESNLFGTVEFVSLCETIGCEPLISVNAGDGTPSEAARWVEYCNGSTDTEMGALRKAHGYPEPFDIHYWEIGNELFGQWQVRWTTPSGNADRYLEFRDAMLETDPEIDLLACGNRNPSNERWNKTLLETAGETVTTITDHILEGGSVDAGTDSDDLFHAFMGYADQLGEEYRTLQQRMLDAGIDSPHLAITELQLFADFVSNRELDHYSEGLSLDTMPTRTTISEPLYLANIVHECIRMGSFVSMITHSATVNHGGGLQKKREQTWADPAHYGHQLLSSLSAGTPIGVDVKCPTVQTSTSFGGIEAIDALPVLDVMAVSREDDSVITIVNRRSGSQTISVDIDVSSIPHADSAEITVLSGGSMQSENTRQAPDEVSLCKNATDELDGLLELDIPPYSLVRAVV